MKRKKINIDEMEKDARELAKGGGQFDPSLETKTPNKESLTVDEILWELVKDRDKVEKILRELFR